MTDSGTEEQYCFWCGEFREEPYEYGACDKCLEWLDGDDDV
jgi:hypothetical protein